jgi:hypothetical protein
MPRDVRISGSFVVWFDVQTEAIRIRNLQDGSETVILVETPVARATN